MTAFVLISLGVILLYTGGEVLVASVTRMAAAFRISPLVIGLTVVAFGTSSPEVAVAIGAGLEDKPAIALGNVIGSNIANLGLILGVSALIRAVDAHASFLRRDLPFLLAITVFLLPAAWLGDLGIGLGVVLLVLLAGYLWVLLRQGGGLELEEAEVEAHSVPGDRLAATIGVVVGIALLVYGADVLVDSAVTLARELGVAERIIGLTLVAFGTSLPELAGCLAAARHGEGDIVIGNVVGSNIFNTLLVLPSAILIRPVIATPANLVDIAVSLVFTGLTFVFFYRRGHLGAGGGGLLAAAYVGYVAFLFLG
ncbi:MAG: calcium/sodium antiporter [Thermoanaerobaculia bacterium]|nr:calcium/sodium antiporter [Thermoanaerobaculia bacterium]